MFDIVTDFRRVFWKNMDFESAVKAARELEPYYGAYHVVPTTDATYGERVSV